MYLGLDAENLCGKEVKNHKVLMKTDELELRCLSESDEAAHADFVYEIMKADGRIVPMAAGFKVTESLFRDWLHRTRKNAEGKELTDGWVPATTMFLFKKNDKRILGAVDIRHELNDRLLHDAGHIGYGVAPSERMKGYASIMLVFALDFCRSKGLKKVLVTCNKENIGSAKTIQKNGGIMENEVLSEKGLRQRYWIDLY